MEQERKKKEEEARRKEAELRAKQAAVKRDPKEAQWINYNDILAEASRCFRNDIAVKSMEKYGEAMNIISTSFKDLNYKNKNLKTCEEVVVIKFMYAR